MIDAPKRQQHAVMGAIATVVALLLIGIGALSYARANPTAFLNFIPTITGSKVGSTPALMSHVLGFDKERVFLVLLLNNTEIRPGGGFIGTYAVVKMKDGKVLETKVEGSGRLDARAPRQDQYPPPKPLQDFLKIDQWQFRDANWSPDFAEGARWSMWLYRHEGGYLADRIDGVIAITATVLDEFVNITGPITANGVTLSPGSAATDLEYEVEYRFADRGIAVADRKVIMQDLAQELLAKLVKVAPKRWAEIIDTAQRLGEEKHLLMYSVYPDIQETIRKRGWSGELSPPHGDGFMVVDANLGAWKTDHAIDRSYTYRVRPSEDGSYEGELRVRYEHNGSFDWRTTRYRSYSRIYLPEDATVIDVEGFRDPKNPSLEVPDDRGKREGFQILGGYVRISPGESQELTARYILPPEVQKNIKKGLYTFSVQKQIGLIDPELTIDLDFGKTIGPSGAESYTETRPLREDYSLELKL